MGRRQASSGAGDLRVVCVVVGVQLTAALGFYAAMGHLALYLESLQLVAGAIAIVLATRVLVQQLLFLPIGAVVDRIGGGPAGLAACLLRTAGFGILAVARDVPLLLFSGVLLGVGGAFFHPAAHTLIAGTAETVRVRGYAAYTAAGQLAAVAGPLLGLAALGGAVGSSSYTWLAGGAALAWAIGGLLFAGLWSRRGPTTVLNTRLPDAVRLALRDRRLLYFIAATAAGPLLAEQAYVAVALWAGSPSAMTVYLCCAAGSAALIQPWCARRDRSSRAAMLQAGFLTSGISYLLLVIPTATGTPVLAAAGLAQGTGTGLLLAAIFRQLLELAPAGRFGVYYGARACVGGVLAFAGGALVGLLFDAGQTGETVALGGLAVVAFAASLACRGDARWSPREELACAGTAQAPLGAR